VGMIGTGLFLGSGSALHHAGPLGALLMYALVGTVAYLYVQPTRHVSCHCNNE
jgi:amino acid permease